METMTPDQVGQWLAAHGGPAGGSGPDANGVITQKAADGSTITTKGQGDSLQIVSKQEAAPATASAGGSSAPSGTPAQPGSGVGSVSQQELEARVAGNPNLKYRGQTTKTRTTPADAFGPGKTEQVPVVTWVDAATGQTIEAEVQPGGGSYAITTDAVVPSNRTGPQVAPRTPEQQTTDAATAQTAVAENQERQWNSDHGYGWLTHAQREQAVRQQQSEARQQQSQDRITAAQEAANQLARDRLQFDKDKANLPDVKATPVDRGGQRYWQVATTTPQGQTKFVNYGPDGKPIDRIPSEGEATRGGPPMPDFSVRDGTIAALSTYHTALYNDPTLTPEQREKRFAEAVQVANAANAQWTADEQKRATEQRERESTRNAEYNVASTRLTSMQNGMNNALDFVSKLNGSLPVGSDLGGKAFAALLGLNMLQLQQSGINNLPSLQRPALPTITPADLSSKEALTTHNQTISQQAAAAAAPTPPVAPAPAQQNTGAGTGEPPARGALPAQPSTPVAAPAAAPSPAGTSLPPDRPDQTQVGSQIDNAISPPAAPSIPEQPGQPGDPGYQTAGPPPLMSAPFPGPTPGLPPPGVTAPPAVLSPWTAGAGPSTAPPDYGQPGMQVMPQAPDPGQPSQYGDGQDMPKLSFGEYPALAGFAPMPPVSMARPQGPPSSAEMPPAMRRAQIASTPPWRLSPEDLDWAHQNGLIDDAMQVPGRTM